MNTIISVLYFVYGLAIGSFLNVIIYRLPLNLPIAKGRSMCPQCETTLKPLDLVPVFSFIFLKGRCRYCKATVSFRYPLVELLTAFLFVMCYIYFGLTIKSIIMCIFICILISATFIDIDHKYIPDRFSVIIGILGILSYFIEPSISIVNRLSGAIFVSGFMLAISLLTKGGIGGGDIKLFFASGLLLGFKLNILSFLLGYVIAGLFIIFPYVMKKLPKNFEVPMVPFFAIAFILSSLWGNTIINWYISLF
ncbi:MAG: prepilin peptidase [Tissierellia bacterium]|nr:prepilin peptidase [Tissierellia bacterium]